MKRGLLFSLALSTLLVSTNLMAKDIQKENATVKKEIKMQKELSKNTPKEMLTAFSDTIKAVQALEQNDDKSASKYLKEATELFDKALKSDSALKLVPVDSQFLVNEVDANSKDVKKALSMVEEALKGHHLEDARVILNTLRDDMIITTQYIPMDTYPLSTKDALKALKKGDKKAALEILMTGFGTTIADTVIIPIPMLTASDAILKASSLDKKNKKEALALLDIAKDELEKAKLLGYTDAYEADYEALTKDIEAIQKEIKGKNAVEKLYDKLKNSFKSLVHKSRTESYKDSVQTKEAKALLQPDSIKGQAAARAKVEETHAKDLFETKQKAGKFMEDSNADESKTIK